MATHNIPADNRRCEKLTGAPGTPDHVRRCTAFGTEIRNHRRYCDDHADEHDAVAARGSRAFGRLR